jgi:holo-[acyl-carrier protein] synthase
LIVGSGVDVVDLERFQRVLVRRGSAFETRIFTPAEIGLARASARPDRALAVRFAAKEAALKALGTGWGRGVGFLDVEVIQRGGRPGLTLSGGAARRAAERGDPVAHLAFTCARRHALAVVLLESPR